MKKNIVPGVFLHDHFYRRICGSPLNGITDGCCSFLKIQEAVRCNPEIFKRLAKLGVGCAELCGPLERAEKMKLSLMERRRIPLILHTDGDPSLSEITSSNSNIAKAALYNIFRNIDLCRELGSGKLVLHPPKFSKQAAALYRKIVGYAAENKVIVAIENCGYGAAGIKNMLAFKKVLPSEFLKFTFDVGHANIGGVPAKLLEDVLEDVAHIHWHDNNGKADQHLGPGMGNADFDAILDVLSKNPAKQTITVTLECDKPAVDYEKAFAVLSKQLEILNV